MALGILLPPLAILPFIDPGLAEDADCSALLNTANETGASTRSAPAAKPHTSGD